MLLGVQGKENIYAEADDTGKKHTRMILKISDGWKVHLRTSVAMQKCNTSSTFSRIHLMCSMI